MKLRRSIALSVAAGAAILMAAPSAASAAPAAPTGTRSLAAVLTANGNGQFDGNPFDYDIVTQAVLAVVGAKPASPVGLLTKGDVALTAFLPPDFAFRDLVRQLTGRSYASEKDVFNALVAAAGVDTIETVLLYHVVPGATIASKDAVNADGAAADDRTGRHDHRRRHREVARPGQARRPGPHRREPLPEPVRARHQQGQQADRARDHRRPAPGRPALTGRLASASP